MNHKCNGDVFRRWGKNFGRCLLGGDIFDLFAGTEFCPICDRLWAPVNGTDWKPRGDAHVALEVDLPHYKRALEEKTRKARLLEEQLEISMARVVELSKKLKALESARQEQPS